MAKPGAKFGREQQIRRDGSLALTAAFLDSYDNHVLLCVYDSQLAPNYVPGELERLKRNQEERAARIAQSGDASTDTVKLLMHTAVFTNSPTLYHFLKVYNESGETIRLDRVWLDTEPAVVLHNIRRPVPTTLTPGELFETWIDVQDVPHHPNIYDSARAEFDNGLVIRSKANLDVASSGLVGGGGQPLSVLAGAVAALNHEAGRLIPKEWDVFISHASTDKDDVVRPLAHALRERGLRVWYDEFELRWGSSLRQAIDRGVAQSRFGVVVLSHAFFGRRWTGYELDGIVARYIAGQQVILPLWHRVTLDDVRAFSPSLAGQVARDTETSTADGLADEIADLIHSATR